MPRCSEKDVSTVGRAKGRPVESWKVKNIVPQRNSAETLEKGWPLHGQEIQNLINEAEKSKDTVRNRALDSLADTLLKEEAWTGLM
jgi:hypothetical protein